MRKQQEIITGVNWDCIFPSHTWSACFWWFVPENNDPVGYGETEEDAIWDLINQCVADGYLYIDEEDGEFYYTEDGELLPFYNFSSKK